MEERKRENLLGVEKISRLMRKFAFPSIVAMLVSAVYNIVDQLFIGQTVGPLGNAATNVAFPLATICTAIALLFGIGGASNFNLAMGEKREDDAPYYVGNSIAMLINCGLFLFAVTEAFLEPLLRFFGSPDEVLSLAEAYVRITAIGFPFLLVTVGGGHLIRADGSPKMTMLCSLSGAVVNIVLDAIFVLAFGWGMKGAALATIFGQMLSGALVMGYLRHFKTVSLQGKHFRPYVRYTTQVMSLGTASCFNQLAMTVVQIVLNQSLTYYGALSEYGQTIPLACAGIVMKLNQIFFAIVIGISQGAQPIEGYNYGAKNYQRVKDAYFFAAKAGAVIGIAFFALFQLAPHSLIALFGEADEAYFEFGTNYLRIFLFFTFANFLQPITSSFFTSIGKPYRGIFLSLTRQIIFLLPLILLLPRIFGISGILYAGPISDGMAMVTALLMAGHEFRGMGKNEI
ncbi:MAG: MATE family efflux transporter [Lachnospiraceae bacterium]